MTRSRISIFFSGGFRPFFLGAGCLAFLFIPLWLGTFLSLLPPISGSITQDWHSHEMLFGYFGAVVAGFLLTAIPNWTGRTPVSGLPLALLFLLWIAGRIVMVLPGNNLDLLVDGAFLVIMTAVALREVVQGRNWRNIPVVAFVGLYALSNIIFHLEQQGQLETDIAVKSGLSILILLIALIGGRIIPAFSINWLTQQGLSVGVKPFGLYDKITLLATAATLILWIIAIKPEITGISLLAAAALHCYRLLRWQGWTVRRNTLLLVLHVAYAWLPVGFLLLAIDLLGEGLPLGRSAGLHALTTGLMTMMTVAVMSRAILGHTGRALAAGAAENSLYCLVFLAALLRTLAPFAENAYQDFLIASALFWFLAFGIFILHFGRMTLQPRQSDSQ